MTDALTLQTMTLCLDNYMSAKGRYELSELEAGLVLAQCGLLRAGDRYQADPLRRFLIALREAGELPRYIWQSDRVWRIRHSKTVAKAQTMMQFFV